jgi:hypothetical protein
MRPGLTRAGNLLGAGAAAIAATGMIIGPWALTPASDAQAKAARPQPVAWAGFAENPQHTSLSRVRPQPLRRIHWRATIDRHPLDFLHSLPTHYGSPMITAANTVLVPTKVSAKAGFRVVAYSEATGTRRWSLSTDYRLTVFGARLAFAWRPPLPAALTPGNALAVAGVGGTVLVRQHANLAAGSVHRLVFYGAAQWKAHQRAYDKAVQVTTPLTAGPDGSLYFGFTVKGATPSHLTSGVVRIAPDSHATWISASAAARDRTVTGVAFNCAPALSADGSTLYLAVTKGAAGFLVGLNATTLKPRFKVALTDPASGQPAMVYPSSSASPVIGPDGDVYFGVVETRFSQHDGRGWLLHFNSSLTREKIPGSFGWDNTPSVVPASAVPGYHGTSPYLLVSKYNNYYRLGPHGDGRNEVALLDPRAHQKDPVTPSVQSMKPVETVLSPVHEPKEAAGARYEWCINAAVFDTADHSVFVNNEDGILYRWDLATNRLTEKFRLNKPVPGAYTSTLIGPDGTIYSINNATLYAVGR